MHRPFIFVLIDAVKYVVLYPFVFLFNLVRTR